MVVGRFCFLGDKRSKTSEVGFDTRAVPLYFEVAGATSQHPIQFVGHESYSLVSLVGRDGGIHVWTVDFNVPFGGKTMFGILLLVEFDFYPNSDDLFFVPKEPFGFVVDECFN